MKYIDKIGLEMNALDSSKIQIFTKGLSQELDIC